MKTFISLVTRKYIVAIISGVFLLANASANQFISTLDGTFGNEPSGSPGPYSWDLYFTVQSPITVTSLGAFDSGSDGLFIGTIQVVMLERNSGTPVSPIIEFTSSDPGYLLDGFRYKALSTPLELAADFQGVIIAFGHSGLDSAYEPFGNTVHADAPVLSFDNGGGLLGDLGPYSYQNMASGITYPGISTGGGGGSPQIAAASFEFSAANHSSVPDSSSYLTDLSALAMLGLFGWVNRK